MRPALHKQEAMNAIRRAHLKTESDQEPESLISDSGRWFWVNQTGTRVSPFLDDESAAFVWLDEAAA